MEGWINVDSSPVVNPDRILDLEKNLPFEDNSIESVNADHVLEHLTNVFNAMEEIYRVCKNGAEIRIEVPHYKSPLAFTNPDHKHFFTEKTFEYYFDTAKEGNPFSKYVTYRFRMKSLKLIRDRRRFKPWFMWPVDRIRVVLIAVK